MLRPPCNLPCPEPSRRNSPGLLGLGWECMEGAWSSQRSLVWALQAVSTSFIFYVSQAGTPYPAAHPEPQLPLVLIRDKARPAELPSGLTQGIKGAQRLKPLGTACGGAEERRSVSGPRPARPGLQKLLGATLSLNFPKPRHLGTSEPSLPALQLSPQPKSPGISANPVCHESAPQWAFHTESPRMLEFCPDALLWSLSDSPLPPGLP